MKKAIIIILTALLVLSAFVSCNDNSIIDDEFTRTVTFEKNNEGATGKMAPQTMVTRTATALDANKFELTDNMFIGWNTKADGSGTSYKDKQEISITEDMTLYAQWTHEIETVSFYANDGTETKVTQDVPKNYATNLKENEFTLDNNHFTGWNTKADGTGTPYADKAEVTLTADLTLYAQWIAKVTFDANLGSGTMDPLEVATNSGITLPKNKFDAPSDKMEFGSWNTKKDGSGTSYDDEDSITAVTGDITLYAQWNNKTVTITYKGNGGSYVKEETTYTQYTQDVDYNKKATILENEFEKGGYEFLTWNTKKDGTGTEYEVGVETADPLTEDFTLYAIWKKLPFSYIDSETTVLKGGETYTIASNVEINGRLIIEGSSPVTLILPKGKTLTLKEGLNVAEGQSLVIEGEGTLTAFGKPDAAGIGGDYQESCGTVTIKGGTINATSGDCAAGIGGGKSGRGGDVTILGGTVTAFGDGANDAVAIGHGQFANDNDDGTLKIGAGVIMMVSTNNTDWSEYDGSTRTQYMKVPTPIVLTSSTTAWTSGNVYTLGDEDVEIGSRITVNGTVFLLLPDGKTLNAQEGITVASGNTLVIDKYGSTATGTGILDATGSHNAAGIGGGYNQAGGTVTINGGTVNATGGFEAAGIGGGCNGSGGTVTINGGTVTATSGEFGTGIGKGTSGDSNGTLELDGVAMLVSDDNTTWVAYDGVTRAKYMKTETVK